MSEIKRYPTEVRLEDLTHDDYKRLLIAQSVPLHFKGEELEKAVAIRGRWLIASHTARFGCSPYGCSECQDGEATERALNCDEYGNPLDEGSFYNANLDGTDRLANPRAEAEEAVS